MARLLIMFCTALLLCGCAKDVKDTEEGMECIKDEYEQWQDIPEVTDMEEMPTPQAQDNADAETLPTEPAHSDEEDDGLLAEVTPPESLHKVEPSEYVFMDGCGIDGYLLYKYWGWCDSYDDLYLSLIWFGEYVGGDSLYGELRETVSDVLVILDSYDSDERPEVAENPGVKFTYEMIFDEELRITAVEGSGASRVFTVLFDSNGFIISISEEDSI